MTDQPTVSNVQRHAGIAGQYSVTATVTYPGEPAVTAEFIGSSYGGPVIAVSPYTGAQVFVTDPGRFGEFGPDWVRRYFAS